MSDAWKSFQRWTCRFFGMECGWRGEEAECYDVVDNIPRGPHEILPPTPFAPEVKYRKSLPKWLTGAVDQANAFALSTRRPYPIVVINTHNRDRMKSLVVMELDKFDWLMRQADLKPHNRNEDTHVQRRARQDRIR